MIIKTLFFISVAMMVNLSFAQIPAATAAQTKPSTVTPPVRVTMPPAAASESLVTALCKDESTFSGDSKKGACSGHKGVKPWTNAEVTKSNMKADKEKVIL